MCLEVEVPQFDDNLFNTLFAIKSNKILPVFPLPASHDSLDHKARMPFWINPGGIRISKHVGVNF